MSWDTDGTMFASDIGMNHIEEVNIVRNGENYGWMRREGYWENGRWRGGVLNELFVLPPDILSGREKDGIDLSGRDVRPRRGAGRDRRLRVSRTDRGASGQVRLRRHPERASVCGRSRRDEEGRRWHSSDGGAASRKSSCTSETQAAIGSASRCANWSIKRWARAISRVDLHIGRTGDGELLLTSRQDGTIRMLVPDSPATRTAAGKR